MVGYVVAELISFQPSAIFLNISYILSHRRLLNFYPLTSHTHRDQYVG